MRWAKARAESALGHGFISTVIDNQDMKVRARFIIVALIAIGLFAIVGGRHGIPGTSPRILQSVASSQATPPARETSTVTQPLPSPAQRELPTRLLPPDTSRNAADTLNRDVSLGLSAEVNPNLGGIFKLEISADSRRPVGRFTLTVNYDPLVLHLVGVRSSEFVVHTADIANFTAGTPANTEGQITISWEGRSIAGTGVLGQVEFELYASGSTAISLSDVEVMDVHGRPVHVAIPEPVLVERHIS